MGLSPNFYFSLAALLAGIGGGIFFLAKWIQYGRAYKFLLFWGIGLLCLFIFQIPTILSNANQHLVLTDFDHFFSILIPISFLGLISIYLGFRSIIRPITGRTYALFALWLALCFAYFMNFFWDSPAFTDRFPLYGMILFFFLPLHLVNLSITYELWKKVAAVDAPFRKAGMIAITLSLFCGLARNGIFLFGFTKYPPAFWFLVLQYPALFWLQIAGVLGTFAGFLLMQSGYLRHREELSK